MGSPAGSPRHPAARRSARRTSISALEHVFRRRSWAHRLARAVDGVLNSGPWTAFVMLATVWSLYGTDIKMSALPAAYDAVFDGIMMAFFVFFCLEFSLACVFVPKYVCSFWFYLDAFATLTMVLDIPLLAAGLPDAITGNGAESQSLQSARAGRAARVGARAGRLSRFLRLIRIAKLIKLGAKRSGSQSAAGSDLMPCTGLPPS